VGRPGRAASEGSPARPGQETMPKFAANLTTMFPELEPKDRFAAAAKAGFEAVEYLRPYDNSKEEVRGWLDDNGLKMLLLNTLPGNRENNERGMAALPGREADFRAAFDLALDYVSALGGHLIHVMAGVVPQGVAAEACEDCFVHNLEVVAPVAAAKGVTLLLEPLNLVDAPGYLHTNTAHTRRIIERVGAPNIGIQYDFYHMQIMQGALARHFEENQDLIKHVQFSSLPGRHEPQYGEVNLPFLFDFLDAVGYDGWVGCEYAPKGDSWEGLSWAVPYGFSAER
jgi:hydroxypyruvate isomerase